MRDSKAALDLMYRRSRCLADLETANKNMDKARAKNKDVQQAETAQENVKRRFETISGKAKEGNEQHSTPNRFAFRFISFRIK